MSGLLAFMSRSVCSVCIGVSHIQDCIFLSLVLGSFWGHARIISLLGLVSLFADVSVQVCGGFVVSD